MKAKEIKPFHGPSYLIGKKEGIREVVEWVEERQLKGECSFSQTVLFQGDAEIRGKDWQAQKKVWFNEKK